MTTIDSIEQSGFEIPKFDMTEKYNSLNKSFDSSIKITDDCYQKLNLDINKKISHWLGLNDVNKIDSIKTSTLDVVKQMYSGVDIDGNKTLGLEEISKMKVNPEYEYSNLKQHSGFSAEVISTAKENLIAQANDTGITTYRADDRPDLFQKNDQYVDKIRVNSQGEIVDRVQTKFVGRDSKECLSQLSSKKYDKYFNDGMVDKIEIPSDYYDEVKSENLKKRTNLENQLERASAKGDTDTVQKIESKIERCNKIDSMVEKSTVSSQEAIYATKHPKRYATKLFTKDVVSYAHESGKAEGLTAAAITLSVSAVDNVQKVINGEITPVEAALDVVKDTVVAGGAAYGTEFISSGVARAMSHSGHKLIKSLGGSGVPAVVISVGIDVFDSTVDFAEGTIDAQEWAYDLGESVANVAGSMAGMAVAGTLVGGALSGAAVGSVVPVAGTVIGGAVGMVGGMVGCAIASEAYKTAVEVGANGIGVLENKMQEVADNTMELVKNEIPDAVNDVRLAFNNFATENNLPFKV